MLALAGEHDVATVPLLDRLALATSPRVVDLTAASFIDGSVINWLVRASRQRELLGGGALLVVGGAPGSPVQQLVDVTRLRHALACFPTRQAACAAVAPAREARAPGAASRRRLRILVAEERRASLERVSGIVTRLGHVVTAKETNIAAVAALTEAESPDVAVVVVGEESERALELVSSIVRDASCPVIALLDVEEPAFVRRAAKCGVFAYIVTSESSGAQLESSIDIVLYRFSEYHDLQGAFGRRAITERAKGVLMERHAIDEEAAFLMLREHSRRENRKLIDIAQALLDARELLPHAGSGAS